MGQLLFNYKKSVFDNLIYNIQSQKDLYYAIGARSVADPIGTIPTTNLDVYSSQFLIQHQLEFGKQLYITDISGVVKNIRWAANTVYDQYDDQDTALFDKNFYVITDPEVDGGNRHVFKCLSNANGAPSTLKPDIIQSNWFEKVDGYRWKYMYSITQQDFDRWGTTYFAPVIANTTIQATALESSGIDYIKIENKGLGYITHNDGVIRSVTNTTCVQIDTSAAIDNDFYRDCSIYMFNTLNQTGQIKEISTYVSNTSGKWCKLRSPANTSIISPGLTSYKISPTVKIMGDYLNPAYAYSVVSNNSIDDIVLIDRGEGYSHAQIKIFANTAYGSGAVARAVVGPPGGHGSKPEAELGIRGISFNIKFANTEGYIMPITGSYSAVGIIRNPKMSSNSTLVLNQPSFSQILKAYVSGGTTFTLNEQVIGQTSGSIGIVYTSNTSVIWMTGDKLFINGEKIIGQTSNSQCTIQVFDKGQVWSKDLDVLYINNINKVQRSPTQSETFKIILEV